jgi:curli production assembly/transport component CsgG
MKRTIKLSILAVAVAAMAGCSTVRPLGEVKMKDAPIVSGTMLKEINNLPAPAGAPIAVAVYGFKDLTGQRKPSQTLSLFSTAVTQGAEAYLIKTLQEAGNRQWFTVVERVGLDNLLKERQMIKQTREIYEGANAKMLPPLTMAGVIIEGGIIDYNSNTLTGGSGVAVFGIGAQTQYTQDVVVISLRLVSVQTGEVLTTVTVEKNLLSTSDGATGLKFFNNYTQSFEFDSSQTFNEPGNYALRSAIEQGIVELVKKGENQGLWKYKQAVIAPTVAPVPDKIEEPKKDIPVSQHESNKTGIVKYWANARVSREYSSQKLMLLKPGTRVSIADEVGTHYQIEFDNKKGWVHRTFVEISES